MEGSSAEKFNSGWALDQCRIGSSCHWPKVLRWLITAAGAVLVLAGLQVCVKQPMWCSGLSVRAHQLTTKHTPVQGSKLQLARQSPVGSGSHPASPRALATGTAKTHCPGARQRLGTILGAERLPECSNARRMKPEFPATLVTGYYAIPSKRPVKTYVNWLGYFLLHIRTPIFFLTSCKTLETVPDVLDIIQQREERIPKRLVATVQELQETGLAKAFGPTLKLQERRDGERRYGHNYLLYLMWLLKTEALMEAIRQDPFCSDWFFWVDSGAFRVNHTMSLWPSPQRLALLPANRVVFELVFPFPQPEALLGRPGGVDLERWLIEYRKDIYTDHLAGGFIGFNRRNNTHLTFHNALRETYKMMIDRDMMVVKDQSVFHLMLLMRPQLFSLLQSRSGCSDPWFYFEPWLADSREYPCPNLQPLLLPHGR